MTRILAVILMLSSLLVTVPGRAQFTPGGGGGHGGPGHFGGGDREEMRTRMEALAALNLEGMWGVLTFGIGLSADQLESLRAPFQVQWDRRAEILKDTDKEDTEGWEAIRDEFKSVREDLETMIKTTIGNEKYKEYSKILKDREKMVRNRTGGGPG
ncbi:MAG TPA: hypothetical protein VF720_03870 [Candidatus Eisenbacteria bacterium]